MMNEVQQRVKDSEQLIRDLYITLRANLMKWSQVTHQTPQGRMGYIGQHLTSIVTGYPGSYTGARGNDILMPGDKFGEIKTCYRVDQLGSCQNCGHNVASIEKACPSCKSTKIKRNDDSKWLITLQSEDELIEALVPDVYYLVLFEFTDINDALNNDIEAKIWSVIPEIAGFSMCLIDYYYNIKLKSKSGAPFNLWPHQLKFYLMCPELIYHATIGGNDDITTRTFPGRDNPKASPLPSLLEFVRSNNLDLAVLQALASQYKVKKLNDRKALCAAIELARNQQKISNSDFCYAIAQIMYGAKLKQTKVRADISAILKKLR